MKRIKKISIRQKFILVVGALLLGSGVILARVSLEIAKKTVTERIEIHLTDKANDTAAIVDARIVAIFQFLEGLSRMPSLRNTSLSYLEKAQSLQEEIDLHTEIDFFGVCDLHGKRYATDGSVSEIGDRDWYLSAKNGKRFVAEPRISRGAKTLQIIFAVPIYGKGQDVIGVLSAGLPGISLSEDIADIVVGYSGYCAVIGGDGTTIAHKNTALVIEQQNMITNANLDKTLESLAAFLTTAMNNTKSAIGFYTYQNKPCIASYAKLHQSNWTLIITAPVEEFMGGVTALRRSMYIVGALILLVTAAIVFVAASKMVKPIQVVVRALEDIAHGEGDLTVRLPILGNDEITELSQYFNQTIEKIGKSISSVDRNAEMMKQIGTELSSNMTQTAGAVHQISVNIDGVKQQTLTQAASVTETSATMEEIIRTIKQLNTNIDHQTDSIALSSSAIEEMVSNIASITHTLETTDTVIQNLAAATADGKDTLMVSSAVTQRVTEESGSLLEASSVIQHIASQTNLLAMNAAIEAAHAGDAGKGFAVVADEIRKLAEESRTQGKSITETLKTLSNEIETLAAASKTAEEKFSVIFELSKQVKDMSTRLMEAMEEQDQGSKEVLSAIKNIKSVTMEVQAGSDEMLRGGESIADEMHKLDDLTRMITDSMTEMAAGAIEIRNAVQEVNDLSQRNKLSIESLVSEVDKFVI